MNPDSAAAECSLTIEGRPHNSVTDARGNVYFTATLSPGFYVARLECRADRFSKDSFYEDSPYDEGARIGPLDFSLDGYQTPKPPTFRVFQNDIDLGPCWCAVPSVEDLEAGRCWTEMGFEIESSDPVTIFIRQRNPCAVFIESIQITPMTTDLPIAVDILPAQTGRHPRLLIDDDDITRLKAQDISFPEPEIQFTETQSHRPLPLWSLAYLVSGDEKYLHAVIEVLDFNLNLPVFGGTQLDPDALWYDLDYPAGEALTNIALTYDWLYAHLDALRRRRIERKLAYHAGKLYRYSILTRAHIPLIFSSGHSWNLYAALGIAALAIWDDWEDAPGVAARSRGILESCLLAFSPDGCPTTGSYGRHRHTERYMVTWIMAFATATGEKIYDRPHFRNIVRDRAARMLDCPQRFLNAIGSTFLKQHYATDGPLLAWLGHCFDCDAARWFARNTPGECVPYLRFLYDRPDEKVPDLWDNSPIEKIEHFESTGMVLARSALTPEAAVLQYVCGPLENDLYAAHPRTMGEIHTHLAKANNAICFGMHGEALIDTSVMHYQIMTRDRNTTTVNGMGYTGEGAPWFVPRAASDERGVIETCEVRSTADSPDGVLYVCGNTAALYKPELGVRKCRRRILSFLPHFFLLVDDLATTAEASLEWNLGFGHGTQVQLGDAGQFAVSKGEARVAGMVIAPEECEMSLETAGRAKSYSDKLGDQEVLRLTQHAAAARYIVLFLPGIDPGEAAVTSVQEGDSLRITVAVTDRSWTLAVSDEDVVLHD